MAVTMTALDGQVMEELKVYIPNLQFIPESQNACVCKVSVKWEKRTEDSEPAKFYKFLEKMIADSDDHILHNQEWWIDMLNHHHILRLLYTFIVCL